MVKSDFHDPLDAQPVDISHGEILDTEALEELAAMYKIKIHQELFFRVHPSFVY